MEQFLFMIVIALAFGAYKVWCIHTDNIRLTGTVSDYLKRNTALQNEVSNLLKIFSNLKEKNKTQSTHIENLTECIEEKNNLYNDLAKNKEHSFSRISSLMADFLTLNYALSAELLERKKRPALKEAQRIKDLKKETKNYIQELKHLKYMYEYLLGVFPDLKPYIEDISALEEIEQYDDIHEFTDATDRVKNFLSSEEYKKLPDIERNQLALDRYIKGRKTNWQIGRDYEMFIGQQYEMMGWNVEYIGIEKKLNDMGRDLIATKEGNTHIIQCKYWAQHKQIHENSIAQLFGTAMHYKMSFKDLLENVTPVLITNIALSDTAKEFATYLDVKIKENKSIEDFPRIKCKIGKNENGEKLKIYHLPMDQQYDTAKISKKDEFYALTVRDAVNKGYRRAFRWRSNN